jgi:hypothetical protein
MEMDDSPKGFCNELTATVAAAPRLGNNISMVPPPVELNVEPAGRSVLPAVTARSPAPDFVMALAAPPNRDPVVSFPLAEPMSFTANTGFPVSVMFPSVIPAVPLVELLPGATVRVFAPIDRVPRVWVTPAPAEVRSLRRLLSLVRTRFAAGPVKVVAVLSRAESAPPESVTEVA